MSDIETLSVTEILAAISFTLHYITYSFYITFGCHAPHSPPKYIKKLSMEIYSNSKWIYRVAPKNGTVNFLGLCSDPQLFFFTLLDRASFPHYNNNKIIKFG